MSAEDKKVDIHSFCIDIFLFTRLFEMLKKKPKQKLYGYVYFKKNRLSMTDL